MSCAISMISSVRQLRFLTFVVALVALGITDLDKSHLRLCLPV
jgi:hypothetical protein